MNTLRPQTVPSDSKLLEKGNELTKQNEKIWKNQTINDIKLNNSAIDKSDRQIFFGKHDDPLTNLREVLRTLSNKEAFKYMRQCRLVVAKLKKCWVDVNEEVKSLCKNKEYLESAIEHVRKDLIINQETVDGRIHKPSREPIQDSVDDSLVIEKQNLHVFKRSLEQLLKPIQEQSFKLDETRDKVFQICRERSCVTDLICQCLTQSIRAYDKSAIQNKSSSSATLPKMRLGERSKTDFIRLNNNKSDTSSSDSAILQVGPLNSFTAESVEIVKIANQQIEESKDLRMRSNILMKDCFDFSKKNTKSVDDVFAKKLYDTLGLAHNLGVSSAENYLAQNRAARWQALTEVSLGYTLGPEKSSNLQTYEQVSRPIVRNYQKHPGNQVPEVDQTIHGSQMLSKSLSETQTQMKTLKIIGQRLDSNLKDKEEQHKLDSALLRRRRELSNHKWVPFRYVQNVSASLKQ